MSCKPAMLFNMCRGSPLPTSRTLASPSGLTGPERNTEATQHVEIMSFYSGWDFLFRFYFYLPIKKKMWLIICRLFVDVTKFDFIKVILPRLSRSRAGLKPHQVT